MAVELSLMARLLAYEQRCSQPISSHRLVAVRLDAQVLSVLAMAGEDTTIHMAACGELGAKPSLRSVPDPRVRDQQYQLFEWLGKRFDNYFRRCRAAGTYPQIWVSSSAAASHLDTLADRLRFNKNNDEVRRFGELLTYCTERFPIAGQQTLQTATSALNLHWITGQDQSEDEHLLTLLTWLDPPNDQNLLAAVANAERVPMGVKTDPDYDRDVLLPLVISYNESRRAGSSQALLDAKAQLIHNALEPVVIPIFKATQRAIAMLADIARPPLPGLRDLEHREAEEFAGFMEARDRGYHLPLRDSAKLAAFRLTAREDAIQNTEATIRLGDRMARAAGRLNGFVVRGEVLDRGRSRLAPRRFRYEFSMSTVQRVLRIRLRDELQWADDPRLRVIVTDINRSGRRTSIRCEILNGQRSIGLPEIGTVLEMIPSTPDWSRLIRERGNLKAKLGVTPWTHAQGEIPVLAARKAPDDPLAAVEALR